MQNEKGALEKKEEGNSHFRKKDYDKALECYKEAIELNPTNAQIYHNCALVYKNKRDWNQAKKYAGKAVSIDPSYFKALMIWGKSLVELGKKDNNLKYIQEGIRKIKEVSDKVNEENLRMKAEKDLEIANYVLILKKQEVNDISKTIFLQSIEKLLDRASSSEREIMKKKIENLMKYNETNYSEVKSTDFLNCPITLNIMTKPMITNEGHTYDNKTLQKHFELNNRCDPSTRREVTDVYNNLAVEDALTQSYGQYLVEQCGNANYNDLRFD